VLASAVLVGCGGYLASALGAFTEPRKRSFALQR
jgi:hypothetical protein